MYDPDDSRNVRHPESPPLFAVPWQSRVFWRDGRSLELSYPRFLKPRYFLIASPCICMVCCGEGDRYKVLVARMGPLEQVGLEGIARQIALRNLRAGVLLSSLLSHDAIDSVRRTVLARHPLLPRRTSVSGAQFRAEERYPADFDTALWHIPRIKLQSQWRCQFSQASSILSIKVSLTI